MSYKPMTAIGILVLALVPLLVLSGCFQNGDNSSGDGKNPPAEQRSTQDASKKGGDAKKNDAEHGHKAGDHGGIIVEIGRDNYHAEAVFEKGGLLKLFTLGKDESKIIDVESQVIKAYVKEESASESVEMDLNPVPRTGDKEGRTSQFIGKLPKELAGKQLAVTIPIILVNGERYRIGFTSAAAKHDEGMPIGAKVTMRGLRMYEFLDRLISLALPRVRDFRGLNPNAFDGQRAKICDALRTLRPTPVQRYRRQRRLPVGNVLRRAAGTTHGRWDHA